MVRQSGIYDIRITLMLTAGFISSVGEGCVDFTGYKDHFLHVTFSGSDRFSISLQQHNQECDESIRPFPATWDSVQASRYAANNGTDIYIPMSHFKIDMPRATAFALESFVTNDTTYIYKMELLPPTLLPVTAPKGVPKLESGVIRVGCQKRGMIAFGIDDGAPSLLQRTLGIIKEENIPVTMFVTGTALTLPEEDGNFTLAYQELLKLGHQVAIHTMSHPHMEGVKTDAEIDKQLTDNIELMHSKLNMTTNYFRPPFGTIGARTRQAVGRYLKNPQLIMWSIDIKDWFFGPREQGDPDQEQLKAFKREMDQGGDIVVMHFLYKSTVDQFRDMIKYAKAAGRQFVRVDQCIGDPAAPRNWGYTG
jgi:peptidoglycan/xylan/chitin deacetylase (PgdA/CDA1 family)